ncbi:MAG: tetratricopeptide repeat protein [Acidobacteriota bacterium]
MKYGYFLPALFAVVVLSAPSGSAQEWRGGRVRVEGSVKNEKGEPIEGAKVHLRWKQHPDGPDLVTDKKGKWAMLGLTGGPWNIDFEAPGYQTRQISAQLKEAERNPPIEIQLQALAPAAGQGAPQEQLLVGGRKVSKETGDAIEKANAALEAKNYAEARVNYEKAVTELPDSAPLLMRLAASYYGENNAAQAIKFARQAAEKDPQDPSPWRMIAEVELQRGNLEAGQAALAKVPEDRIKSGQPYLNIGIILLNKKKAAEAESAFSKAISVQPDLVDAYYMRGLARYQQKKNADTKADLHKYLELAPKGTDAATAKEILNTLK